MMFDVLTELFQRRFSLCCEGATIDIVKVLKRITFDPNQFGVFEVYGLR